MGQIGFFGSSYDRQPHGNRGNTGLLSKGFDMFWVWRERHRGRAELIGMPDGMLKDIGLSRGDAESEYEKPFWRG